MSRLAGLRAALLAAAVLTLTAGTVASASLHGGTDTDEQAAADLLQRAVVAGAEVAYTGVQYFSCCHATVVTWVQHVPGRGSEVRVQGTPGGPASEVWDADSDVASIADIDVGALALLRHNYRLALGGLHEVAGRPSRVVLARRPDDGSVAGSFWVDQSTGLLLRRELLDRRGEIVRMSVFTEVTVGAPALRPASEKPTDMVPAPWGTQWPVTASARLAKAGWQVPSRLAGGMQLYDIRMCCGKKPDVVHLSYTDGLSTISVFEQHGHLDPRQFAGWRRDTVKGAPVYMADSMPQRAVWSGPRTVYTLLADAAPDQVRSVVGSLPHAGRTDHGLLHRILHGLARIASWLNPFD